MLALLPVVPTVAVARPVLRLGGEWAGWRCAFSPSGTLCEAGASADCTTESWEGSWMRRRSVQIRTDSFDRSFDRQAASVLRPNAVGSIVTCSVLPTASNGAVTLSPGARAGPFKSYDLDQLNSDAWALDGANGRLWRCESVFDGHGGERRGADGVDALKERTRVACFFDPATGTLSATDSVLVWQERCWSVRPTPQSDDDIGRLDAAWTAGCAGLSCFGEQSQQQAAQLLAEQPASWEAGTEPDEQPTLRIALAGGVEVRGRPNLLDISVTARTQGGGAPYWRKLLLRRSWIGGSCFTKVIEEETASWSV